jgi:hypothetical protein
MADLDTTIVRTLGGVADIEDEAVSADGDGDTAETGPGCFLYMGNSGGSSTTATIETTLKVHGHEVADAQVTIEAGDFGIIPLNSRLFRGDNGRASITYDDEIGFTVAAFKLGS